MNKKIILITTLILLIIFSFGCQRKSDGPGPSDRKDPITPSEMDYHKGTKALTMKFIENQPPNEVWEGTPFQIALDIKNEGATDIAGVDEGLLYISGFKYINVNREKSFSLEGKDQFNPEGGFGVVTFPAEAVQIDDRDQTDSFVITACYKYKTEAGVDICINPNVLDIAKIKEGECKPNTVSASGGQGAPITVTKIEQEYIPIKIPAQAGDTRETKVLFKIHIANRGDGKVVSYDAYEKKCRQTGAGLDAEKELNVVRVKDVRFSEYALDTAIGAEYRIDCTGFKDPSKREIKIPISKDLVMTCSATLYGDNAYISPLTVELEYGYNQYLTKAITVKNIGT